MRAGSRSRTRREHARVLSLCACVLGCEAAAAGTESGPPGAPSESTGSSGSAAGTTFDESLPCVTSAECDGGYCVAPFDAGLGTSLPATGMGAAVCVDACVPERAFDRWCVDDAACCDGLLCTPTDGLCAAPWADSETSVGDSWSTLGESSDSGGTSSTGDESTTGTGTGTGTETGETGTTDSTGAAGSSESDTG